MPALLRHQASRSTTPSNERGARMIRPFRRPGISAFSAANANLSRENTFGVIAGHSRPKDGVASLAYDPAIQYTPMDRWLLDARFRGHDIGVRSGIRGNDSRNIRCHRPAWLRGGIQSAGVSWSGCWNDTIGLGCARCEVPAWSCRGARRACRSRAGGFRRRWIASAPAAPVRRGCRWSVRSRRCHRPRKRAACRSRRRTGGLRCVEERNDAGLPRVQVI